MATSFRTSGSPVRSAKLRRASERRLPARISSVTSDISSLNCGWLTCSSRATCWMAWSRPKPGFHRDHQQVERIRQREPQDLLALGDFLLQEEARQNPAGRAAGNQQGQSSSSGSAASWARSMMLRASISSVRDDAEAVEHRQRIFRAEAGADQVSCAGWPTSAPRWARFEPSCCRNVTRVLDSGSPSASATTRCCR